MFFVFVSLSLCSKIPVPGVLCGDRLLNLILSLKQLWKYSWPFQTYRLSIGDLKYIDHTILVGTQDWPQDMHPWQSPWLTENCDVRPISHFCDVFSDLLLRLSACLCEFIFSYEKLHFPARFASDQSNISSRHLSFLKSTILYHQSRRGLKDFLRPSSCFGSLGCQQKALLLVVGGH